MICRPGAGDLQLALSAAGIAGARRRRPRRRSGPPTRSPGHSVDGVRVTTLLLSPLSDAASSFVQRLFGLVKGGWRGHRLAAAMAKQRSSCRKRFSSLGGASAVTSPARSATSRRTDRSEASSLARLWGGSTITSLAERLSSGVEMIAHLGGRADTERLGCERQRHPKSVACSPGR
jgi:hypothetical protein